MEKLLLLTWTPDPVKTPGRNLKARIYRRPETGTWIVLIRDAIYDDAKRRRYVSQRDFDMLADAERHAIAETGKPAKISL